MHRSGAGGEELLCRLVLLLLLVELLRRGVGLLHHQALGLKLGQGSWRREARICESRRQALVVLLERVLSVVEHKMTQRLVDIVRLGKAKSPFRRVDYAVIHRSLAPVNRLILVINILIVHAYKCESMY